MTGSVEAAGAQRHRQAFGPRVLIARRSDDATAPTAAQEVLDVGGDLGECALPRLARGPRRVRRRDQVDEIGRQQWATAQRRFLAAMTDLLRSARSAGLGPDDIESIYRTAVRNCFTEGVA